MGDNVTLSEYLGKKNIVLYFYPKDESPGVAPKKPAVSATATSS